MGALYFGIYSKSKSLYRYMVVNIILIVHISLSALSNAYNKRVIQLLINSTTEQVSLETWPGAPPWPYSSRPAPYKLQPVPAMWLTVMRESNFALCPD